MVDFVDTPQTGTDLDPLLLRRLLGREIPVAAARPAGAAPVAPTNIQPTLPALAPGTLGGGREIPVSGTLAAKLGLGTGASEESARPSVRWPNALVPLRAPGLVMGREIPMASDADGSYAPLRSLASGGLAPGNLNVATPAAAPINPRVPPPAPMDTTGAIPRNSTGLVRRGDYVAAGGNPSALGVDGPQPEPPLQAQMPTSLSPGPSSRWGGIPVAAASAAATSPATAAGTGSAPLTAGSGLPALRPGTLTLPDPNDPKYRAMQPHGLKRVGLTLASAMGGPFSELASRALYAPEVAYNRDVAAQKTSLGLADTQSQIELRRAEAARDEREANKPDNPEDKKIDEGFNDQNQRVLTFQRPNGETYTKIFPDITRDQRQTHTSPFEAFAYGSAEERKAAQDFLDLEKRVGRRYEKPGEVEQRYSLYQKDPEAYKAMFGDRGGAQDEARTAKEQANATRMLNYFSKQRQQIESDWTLDETQKAAKLAEIEQLSQPYLNVAKPGGANGTGGAEDRVTVRDSKGNVGTVPRSKLGQALKKGYTQAQ